jgi:hypothetical protein
MGSLFKIACVTALGFAIWHFGLRDGCGTRGALECPRDATLDEGVGIVLAKEAVCPGAGYFCHELRREFTVARWPLDTGKLRVRVAPPEFADAEWARALRDAAVEGIMGWDRRPFPLALDTGNRTPLRGWDINVNWHEGRGGGHARVSLNVKGKRLAYAIDGLQVLVPPTLQLDRDQVLAIVKATAAHEMGHALGLMHSDAESDIMFPQFRPGITPAGVSARDLRTVEALYALPNGAVVQ